MIFSGPVPARAAGRSGQRCQEFGGPEFSRPVIEAVCLLNQNAPRSLNSSRSEDPYTPCRYGTDLVGAGRGAHPAGRAPVPVPGRQRQQPHACGGARRAAGVAGGALRHPGGTASPADSDGANAVLCTHSRISSSPMPPSDLRSSMCVGILLPAPLGLSPQSAN